MTEDPSWASVVFDEAENQLKKQKAVVCLGIYSQGFEVGISTLSRART